MPENIEPSDGAHLIKTDGNSHQSFGLWRKLGGWMAESVLLRHGRRLYERNRVDWLTPMTKFDKLTAGAFIILKDFSQGLFPPKYEDMAQAYQAEVDYFKNMPGVSLAENMESHLRKPFWGAAPYEKYSHGFGRLLRVFEEVGHKRGNRILELGCGSGWMAEFLVQCGYSVVGCTIAPWDIQIAEKRAAAIRLKGFTEELQFKVCPMESVDQFVDLGGFDGVIVFEALHHAFDWRKALQASYRCLKSGGWLVIADEPNVLHTCVSYRVAKLSNTHEIGFSQRQLVGEMRKCSFQNIRIFAPKLNNWISTHWIAAQK